MRAALLSLHIVCLAAAAQCDVATGQLSSLPGSAQLMKPLCICVLYVFQRLAARDTPCVGRTRGGPWFAVLLRFLLASLVGFVLVKKHSTVVCSVISHLHLLLQQSWPLPCRQVHCTVEAVGCVWVGNSAQGLHARHRQHTYTPLDTLEQRFAADCVCVCVAQGRSGRGSIHLSLS